LEKFEVYRFCSFVRSGLSVPHSLDSI